MRISFIPGGWENAGLAYAYSWRFPALPVFRQEADCIANSQTSRDPDEFDYMGLLVPGAYGEGAAVAVRCGFEKLGAPMLLMSMADELDENGVLRTLEYCEIVIWKYGLNVWRHHTQGRATSHYLVLSASFSLAEDEVHTLSAQVEKNHLLIEVDGHSFRLYLHDLQAPFRLGWAACEGICRLYEMTVSGPADGGLPR